MDEDIPFVAHKNNIQEGKSILIEEAHCLSGVIRIGKLQQTNYAVTLDVLKDHASVAISQYYQI